MEFNQNWNKDDNDQLRKMIKEGKSEDEIITFFGKEKISHHPNKKYTKSKAIHTRYVNFINEIKVTPKKTEFTYRNINSLSYIGKKDIFVNFTINNHDYVIVLFYLFENNIKSYEILFTTKEQYIEYDNKMKEILSYPGPHFTEQEHELLKNILEEQTNYNELYTLIKSITYILNELYDDLSDMYGNIIFSITETDNLVKIRLYKNLIKDSFPNFEYFTKTIKIRNTYKDIYYYMKK